jgi:hypothetical protein
MQLLGFLMLAALTVAALIATYRTGGWSMVAIAWGGTFALCGFVGLATALIAGVFGP